MVLPFVRDLFADVEKLPAFLRVASHLKDGTGRIGVSGLSPTAKALLFTLWQKHSIQSRFYRKPERPLDTYVVLLPAEELNEPDLLLYWAADAPPGNVLPGEAQLVGAFAAGKAFLLPLNETRTGHLVLFSPAHQTVFDIARVEKLP